MSDHPDGWAQVFSGPYAQPNTAFAVLTCECGEVYGSQLVAGPGNDFRLQPDPNEAGWQIFMGDEPSDTEIRCPKCNGAAMTQQLDLPKQRT